MMSEERKGMGDIISTVTIAVLFFVIIILVVFSAASYRHAAEVEAANNRERALLSYVVSAIRDSRMSEITPVDFGGAEGVSIRDAGSKYERRIYMKGGKLLEEYAEEGKDIDPEEALVIGETDTFKVSRVSGDLLKVSTGLGSSYVAAGQDQARGVE